MKNTFMKLEIEITEKDVDKSSGFFWMEFKFDGEAYYLQLCLGGGETGKLTKKITENGGYDQGVCRDSNKKSFDKFGKEACLSLLLRELKTTV